MCQQMKIGNGWNVTRYLVGTGGWAYFQAPGTSSLTAYAKCFDFVEVNSTFYQYPASSMVKRWRRTVPRNFTFTVRCHHDLTHRIGLKPVAEAHAVFNRMIDICHTLNAPFLHLLTPSTRLQDETEIRAADDFLSSCTLKGVRLAWELRSPLTPRHVKLMQDHGIIHSVDLSRAQPACKSDTVYSRVFGKGHHNIYQFVDEELEHLDKQIPKTETATAIVTFHGLRMNTDAARFKRYVETGTHMPVTAYVGVESAKAVLQEDAHFPSTRGQLIRHQGWKVIDMTETKRVHLSELLSRLPDRTYSNLPELSKELEAIL
jgi:uncharacterized protein YecE (DUF72 family)